MMLNLAEWIARAGWPDRPGSGDDDVSARAFAITALDRCSRRAKKRGRDLADLDDADRHAARKAAKKLRYAADFFSPLFAGDCQKSRQRFGSALADLQEQLGLLNDLSTAPGVLERLGIAEEAENGILVPPGSTEPLLQAAEQAYQKLVDARKFWT